MYFVYYGDFIPTHFALVFQVNTMVGKASIQTEIPQTKLSLPLAKILPGTSPHCLHSTKVKATTLKFPIILVHKWKVHILCTSCLCRFMKVFQILAQYYQQFTNHLGYLNYVAYIVLLNMHRSLLYYLI